MQFKKILPYVLFGGLIVAPFKIDEFHNACDSLGAKKPAKTVKNHQNIQTRIQIDKPELKKSDDKLQDKAQELCDTYISLVLQGQQNIKHSYMRHARAVASELPGAPVGMHCIYAQYTQLNRALQSLGDTLTLIPYTSRNSCPRFRSEMRRKYNAPEYDGALHNGKLLKPGAYKEALAAFLKRNNVTDDTPDSIRQTVIAKFRKANYSVEELHPGTILIIQKSANPNNTHAVMFLGRGRVKHGSFVSDEKGKFMYAGYNRESVADIFAMYNTDNVFAVDVYNIALAEYKKEFQKINNMDDADLYQFVYDIPKESYAYAPDRKTLEDMAQDKYFDKKTFKPTGSHTNIASIGLGPVYFVAKDLNKSR